MKALSTINVRVYSVIILFIITLSSCSITNKFSSQKATYHLNLVKAESTTENIKISSASAPAKTGYDVRHSYPVKQMIQPATLSLTATNDMPATFLPMQKIDKQKHIMSVKSYFTPVNKNIKVKSNYFANILSYHDKSDLLDKPATLFLICLLCGLAAALCFVFAPQIPFLYFIGYLVAITAIIFFAVWLIAVVEYYYD